jgi:5'-3' exoribonuclease 1
MGRLSVCLKYFITKKVREDHDWKNVQIIFSGHDVPGEGEHKIMEYIRAQKAQPEYEPNQSHCLYGLDADLIMLSLASHEPHFCLIREEGVLDKRKKAQSLIEQKFHLLHIGLVREYFELEFKSLKYHKSEIPFDFERVIGSFNDCPKFYSSAYIY